MGTLIYRNHNSPCSFHMRSLGVTSAKFVSPRTTRFPKTPGEIVIEYVYLDGVNTLLPIVSSNTPSRTLDEILSWNPPPPDPHNVYVGSASRVLVASPQFDAE